MSMFNSEQYERYKKLAKSWIPLNEQRLSDLSEAVGTIHQQYIEDFVFIHINKCGGTSMERALAIPLLNHDTAIERRLKLGEHKWERRYKFALVRHPYDRLVSLYYYSHAKLGLSSDSLKQGFPRWLDEIAEKNMSENVRKNHAPQWNWISDSSGKLILDATFKLENISEGIHEISRNLGREVHLKKLKKGHSHENRSELLSDNSKKVIQEVFNDDFTMLDYHP